jgi:acyl dehydratase
MRAATDDQFAALVGRPVGRGPSVAPDPVNLPMIRHWTAAFEDANPIYTDAEAAARTRHGGIVAPPLMLQTWTMATPRITGIGERGGSPVDTDGAGPLAALDAAGLTATLATDSEFEIVRYLRPGDVITAATVIESISAEKRTRIGTGRFVTWATTYTDATGAVVGRQRFRILKFDPARAGSSSGSAGTSSGAPAPPTAVAPSPARPDGQPGISAGARLPTMEIAVTATVIVAGAIATRDFMPVHHDRDYAQAQGAPDIFMNILSDTAYSSRFLTDWAGAEATIRRLAIRLGVPVFPGHTLRYDGTVSALTARGDEVEVEVAFTGVDDLGPHVTGTALLTVPAA